MSRISRWWPAGISLLLLAVGEWLAAPAPRWAVVTALAALAATVLLLPRRGWAARALVVGLLLAGALVPILQVRLDRIHDHWDSERERRITAASRRLAGDLDAAFDRVEAVSERARALRPGARAAVFAALAGLLPAGEGEVGVVLLEPTGVPWAWAGSHHRIPEPDGPGLSSRVDGYYLLLESRRRAADGRVAVATALVWAHPAAPGQERSIAERFRQRTGVGLAVYAPGTAPDDPDVFDYDYEDPSSPTGRRLLFSVRLVPPEQAMALATAAAGARAAVITIVAAVLLVAFGAAPPTGRVVLGALAPWLIFRAAEGSGAAGALPAVLTAGAGLLVLAVVLVRRRPPGRVLVGGVLLAAAPAVLVVLRGALPVPGAIAGGGPWLAWHLALALPAAAALLLGAELVRPSVEAGPGRWPATAILLGVLSLWLAATGWRPGTLAPPTAGVAWFAALAALTLPARRSIRLLAAAVTASAGAGMLTWSALQAERLSLAAADVEVLGVGRDARPAPALGPAIEAMARPPEPSTATELFVRWRAVALADSGYPAHLALHEADGSARVELALDSLDLPPDQVQALAASVVDDAPVVARLVRSPGVVDVGTIRLGSGRRLVVALGPRTELIPRTRLGGLLLPPHTPLPYRLALGPARPGPAPQGTALAWERQGWTVRAERDVALPEGTRTAQAAVSLRSGGAVAVRLALMLVIDAGLVALLWWLAGLAAEGGLRFPDWERARRSYRLRLAVTLALFCLVPAAVFTAWGLARLQAESARARDREILRVLREAAAPAAALLRGQDAALGPGLGAVSARVGGELALYSGGALLATGAPILRDLGVVQPLLDPDAFGALALGGGLDLVRPAGGEHSATRIGYRVVQSGPPSGVGVVAVPLRVDEAAAAAELEDLALALVLAGLLGAAAAAAGARLAARALARPVADLREAALAIGGGELPPAPASPPPAELEPVFGAMRRMADDVRATQAELEAARARTAAVLATVATGVVALGADGRVLLANPRARELLGRPLAEGDDFVAGLTGEWAPAREVVAATVEAGTPGEPEAEAEFEAGGRRLTLQAARLARAPGGLVLAFNDVTEAARAARVLAWGEMARQVAHEIKNPLTPLRLGVQHLQRAWRRGPEAFAPVLEQTGGRILGEIDRLDTIARIFSRFGAPPEAAGPLEPVDITAAAAEVVQLYALAEDGARVRLVAGGAVERPARRDEVKEMLVNLLENARNASASEIVVDVGPGELSVRDDGRGIPAADVARVFEPRFSSTTSGAGLGLAIVRRLVEGWGATVRLHSEPGRGTIVRVTWPAGSTLE
ncbi:MAG TPA: ATP-binding protein [Gemmatimonadales bacterium]|nr:ATP-binding protein [Gemmatimonadales bacterium]